MGPARVVSIGSGAIGIYRLRPYLLLLRRIINRNDSDSHSRENDNDSHSPDNDSHSRDNGSDSHSQ